MTSRRFFGSPGHWHDRIMQPRSGIDCAESYGAREAEALVDKVISAIWRYTLATIVVGGVWWVLIFAYAVGS